MQRLGVASARPDGSGVVYDDVGPTGLQRWHGIGARVSGREPADLAQARPRGFGTFVGTQGPECAEGFDERFAHREDRGVAANGEGSEKYG